MRAANSLHNTNTEMYGVTDLKYYVFIKAETTKKQTGSLKQLDASPWQDCWALC